MLRFLNLQSVRHRCVRSRRKPPSRMPKQPPSSLSLLRRGHGLSFRIVPPSPMAQTLFGSMPHTPNKSKPGLLDCGLQVVPFRLRTGVLDAPTAQALFSSKAHTERITPTVVPASCGHHLSTVRGPRAAAGPEQLARQNSTLHSSLLCRFAWLVLLARCRYSGQRGDTDRELPLR